MPKKRRRQSLTAWVRANLRATDGPDAGEPVRLERWQHGLLTSIDRERRPIVAVRAASQIGKTLLMLGVGLRGACVVGSGTLLASATGDSVKDLRRRLDRSLALSTPLAEAFSKANRRGPGAASWNNRQTRRGGWISLAAAGSPSQLASRTVAVAVADEVARWPRNVRSGEGHPLALLRARLADWGEDARLLAISSPVLRRDAISQLFNDGDRRRLEYTCPACRESMTFAWDRVTGRERGETPAIACERCGTAHGEGARRRMLRSARWVATREAIDEDVISFTLSRLDSARSSLAQVVKEWRRARREVERGEPDALRVFRNLILGLPGESGAADVDKLFEGRGRDGPDLDSLEQCTAGVDVQADRLVWAVLGFTPRNQAAAVIDYGAVLGDPAEDEPWAALASALATPAAGLPVTAVSVDAGFLTSAVRKQCDARRWWLPTVGRAGEGRPIARRPGPTGILTLGKNDASAWWSGRVGAGHVRLPERITRPEIAELCAAEALTAERGRLVWRPVEGRANHLWDAALLAVHSRHFRPLTSQRRRFRLRAVG